jgi:tetratricopeptide (TPR) repeat protein
MAKIYVSSTFVDLKDQRAAVDRTLRRLGHEVTSMENYVAGEARPLDKCLADVAGSDVYVGLFAWRYGYVPAADNPDGRSITELEYRKAGELAIPRLIFLLREGAPWPSRYRDQETGEGDGGGRIRALRGELEQRHVVAYFETSEGLTTEVSLAAARLLDLGRAEPIHFQLPADVADFTGREAALAQVRGLLDRGRYEAGATAVVISAIAGKAGVGKTALAVHLAHQLGDRYPDQLYVNLRGAEAQRLDPADVLAEFLRTLGMDSAAIPERLEDRSRRYRERLAGRRALVVLDNAATEAQVRPLLPGSPTCAVLITSRAPLAGLEAAQHLTLDLLEPDQALELLAKVAGRDRVLAEPEAATTIVRLCGQLPLAVRIAGAKLATRHHWRLSRLAARLEDERLRLGELEAGDLEVRASFALSYQGRDDAERQTFRLLGILTAPDFPSWVAAAITGRALADAEEQVERLVQAQLLEVVGEDAVGQLRYRFHDLLRIYARERLWDDDPPAARKAAVERVLDGYLGLVEQAATLQFPQSPPDVAQAPARRWAVRDRAVLEPVQHDPMGWFAVERPSLVAMVEVGAEAQAWELTWRLADKLPGFFRVRNHWEDWQHTHELALAAARNTGDRRGEAWILRNLANAYRDQNRYHDAIDRFTQSLAIFRELGNRLAEGMVLNGLGDTYVDQSRFDEAIPCYDQCLSIARQFDDRVTEAYTLHRLGYVHREQGRLDDAAASFRRCQRLFRELGDTRGEAWSLMSIGGLCRRQGRFEEALTCFDRCLPVLQRFGDRIGEAWTLLGRAEVHHDQGRVADAAARFREALAIFRELGGRRGEAHTLQGLGTLQREQGRLDEAITCLKRARSMYRELGDRLREATTLTSLGLALRARGDRQAAQAAWNEAMPVLEAVRPLEAAQVRQWIQADR